MYNIESPSKTSFEKWFESKADHSIDNSYDLSLYLANLLVEVWEMKQAKIDSLMMEYCPDEMSDEQVEEWANHQKVVNLDDIPSCLDKE